MDKRKVTTLLLLSISLVVGAFGQNEARIESSQGIVTAGDHLEMKIDLSAAATCVSGVRVYFQDAKSGDQFQMYGQTVVGQTQVKAMQDVPRDVAGGEYKSVQVGLDPCPGYGKPKNLKINEIFVTVKPFPNPIEFPATATITLSLTQKQFLETQATKLSALKGQLDAGIENTTDPSKLRQFLIGINDEADDDLMITERQYREEILKAGEKIPAFFDDFHAQYTDLRVYLKTTPPGTRIAHNRTSAGLVYVQLKTRPLGDNPPQVRPPEAEHLWHLITDNIKAYFIVKDAGRLTFHASLSSFPMGARVYYKKMIDVVYMDYSSPTNVSFATFDLAYWDFKFHKEGCADDQYRHINPYEENDPANITVEFNQCKGPR